MLNRIKVNNKKFIFETKPGVFAQYGIDYGSRLLLKVIDIPEKGMILDLGSGCGVLGIVIAGLAPKTKVYLVDSDIRAVRLSEENAERNKVDNIEIVLSDVVADLPDGVKFDLIVSNPPTHQGHEVLMKFIKGAHSVLNKRGEAYFVVNRMTSVLDRLRDIFENSEKIKRKKGYIVYKSIK